MALDIVTSVEIAPRGGLVATAIVATGVGFGTSTGRVIFDPLGQAIDATVTLWQDDRVEFTVPAGLSISNQFTRCTFERLDISDQATVRFWLPDSALTPLGPLPVGLDYQWPEFEEGIGENVDDPRTSTAADFNRLLDRMRFIDANGAIPPSGLPVNVTPGGTISEGSSGTASRSDHVHGFVSETEALVIAQQVFN